MLIKLNDSNFYGDLSSSKCFVSDKIQWDRTPGTGPVVVFTDMAYSLAKLPLHKKAFKIAWQLEPLEINQAQYYHLLEHHKDFDLILSHDEDFLRQIPNGEFIPACMTWIPEEDWKIHPKSKNISIIASSKTSTFGHRLRHEIIQKFGDRIDVFGYGYNPIENKADALRDYKFSISVENSWRDTYNTEKYWDCLGTGTVPIYWGCAKVGNLVNYDGLFVISGNNPLEELNRIIDATEKDDIYKKALESGAIQENFETAKKYRCQEDFLYEILEKRGLANA